MYGCMVVFLCYFTFGISSGCETISGIVFFDEHIQAKNAEVQQALELLKHFIKRHPEHSDYEINVIGKAEGHISSVLHKNDNRWLDKLNESLLYDTKDRYIYDDIQSHVVQLKYNSYFSPNKYKLVAEIVVFFVSSSTSLDDIPLSLLKKKTIVVVFGESASQQWKTLSSSGDHLFLVNRTANLDVITERLFNTTCTDSSFYCDTDQYSTKKGAKCKDCIGNACTKNHTKEISNTCKFRCPFFRSMVPTMAVITRDVVKENERSARIPDHKHEALKAIGIVLIVMGILTAPILLVAFVIDKKQPTTRTHHNSQIQELQRRGGNDERIDTDMQQRQVLINESVPQQETQGAVGGESLADKELAVSLLKNEAEKELNELATGQPPIYDVQTAKP